MPVPLIPIVSLAAKVSWPVVLKVVAATAALGGTGGVAYELGKEKGKYEGEKTGRAEQAQTDKEKFYQQEDEFRRQKEKFAKEKAELEEILKYYEAIIEELRKKYRPTKEEISELERAIAEYNAVEKLYASYDEQHQTDSKITYMVFDWKHAKEEALKNGFREETGFGGTRIVAPKVGNQVQFCVFRNFGKLEFDEECRIENCVFDDCAIISFDDCTVENCTFRRIGFVFSIGTVFTNSRFTEMFCGSDTLISLEDSEIIRSKFADIQLRNEAYLCDAVGDCSVVNCEFSNCSTDREDLDIIHCEETAGKVFKRKKAYDITVDCIGLDQLQRTRG